MLKALHKIDFDGVPSLHLFDTLITPILNYNCQVWNQISKYKIEAINNKEYRLEKLYFDTPGEKLHFQFCRNFLGVSNKTSVVATLGELVLCSAEARGIRNQVFGHRAWWIDHGLRLLDCLIACSKLRGSVEDSRKLGCYPLMIKSFSQMIKYWHYIKTQVDSSTLIYKAVSFMESRESLGQYTWLSSIKFILFYCGMEEVWFNPQTIKNGSIASK